MKRYFAYILILLFSFVFLSTEAYSANQPTRQARYVGFSNKTTNSVEVSWFRGNGSNSALFVYQGSIPDLSNLDDFPSDQVDGTTLTDGANTQNDADFTRADNLTEEGWVCVYIGTANSATVTGLSQNTEYSFLVMEYNEGSFPMPNSYYNFYQATSTANPRSTKTNLSAPTIFNSIPAYASAEVRWDNVVNTSATTKGYKLEAMTNNVAPFTYVTNYENLDIGWSSSWASTGSWTVNSLAENTQYYWRVKAYEDGRESDWSTIQTFTTLNQPVPTVSSVKFRPYENSTLVDNYTCGSATTYTINESTDYFAAVVTFNTSMMADGTSNPSLTITSATNTVNMVDESDPFTSGTFNYVSSEWTNLGGQTNDTYIVYYSVADLEVYDMNGIDYRIFDGTNSGSTTMTAAATGTCNNIVFDQVAPAGVTI
ncbi:MAG: fibronectin type III domain-containing protein, partial [Candidatus Kapaibacterium sp.]